MSSALKVADRAAVSEQDQSDDLTPSFARPHEVTARTAPSAGPLFKGGKIKCIIHDAMC